MDKFIFKMEVRESVLPKRMNWLGNWEDDFEDDDFEDSIKEFYFPSFEEMSKKLNELTDGYNQYWADVHDDLHGNSVENLEYHNGYGEWDREYHIETSRLYLTDTLLSSIEQIRKETILEENKLKLEKFAGGFENKSGVDTQELCREARGKS